jgi:hypothetical protein
VIDSCVFGHLREWLAPLVDAAENGYVQLIWSPVLIAEVNRLRTWLWIQSHPSTSSTRQWAELSQAAKQFMLRVHPVFETVDDRAPNELLWTDKPRDRWDIPLWNAAIRSGADYVVTENLRDGPPPGADGVRRHQGIVFIHPTDFLALLQNHVDQLIPPESDEGSA